MLCSLKFADWNRAKKLSAHLTRYICSATEICCQVLGRTAIPQTLFCFLNSQSWNICHTRSPYSYLTVCLFWLSVWFELHGIKNSIKHFIEYYSFPGFYNLYFYINYIYNFSKHHNIPNIFYKASMRPSYCHCRLTLNASFMVCLYQMQIYALPLHNYIQTPCKWI